MKGIVDIRQIASSYEHRRSSLSCLMLISNLKPFYHSVLVDELFDFEALINFLWEKILSRFRGGKSTTTRFSTFAVQKRKGYTPCPGDLGGGGGVSHSSQYKLAVKFAMYVLYNPWIFFPAGKIKFNFKTE